MTHTRHGTLTLERSLAHPRAAVFAAFAEPKARATWAPPTPDLNMTYQQSEFRVGGRDVCICGPGPAEGVTVETLYHAIDPDQRIVSSETIGTPGGPEGVSLITTEFLDASHGCNLKVTIQAVSLGETDSIQDMTEGWTAALDNLGRYLDG